MNEVNEGPAAWGLLQVNGVDEVIETYFRESPGGARKADLADRLLEPRQPCRWGRVEKRSG